MMEMEKTSLKSLLSIVVVWQPKTVAINAVTEMKHIVYRKCLLGLELILALIKPETGKVNQSELQFTCILRYLYKRRLFWLKQEVVPDKI